MCDRKFQFRNLNFLSALMEKEEKFAKPYCIFLNQWMYFLSYLDTKQSQKHDIIDVVPSDMVKVKAWLNNKPKN